MEQVIIGRKHAQGSRVGGLKSLEYRMSGYDVGRQFRGINVFLEVWSYRKSGTAGIPTIHRGRRVTWSLKWNTENEICLMVLVKYAQNLLQVQKDEYKFAFKFLYKMPLK
jgi:hypothetical protein